MSRLQQCLIRGQARLVLHERRLRSGKRHLQRGRDGLRDFVLHVEQVRHLAVVALRPEMIAVAALMSCAVTRRRVPDRRTLPSRMLRRRACQRSC